MDPGRLKFLVTLQSPPTTQDDSGQPTGDWVDVTDLRADIRVVSGMESIRADAATAIGMASVRIRRRAGVTAGMRFLHGSTVYEIQAVPPVSNDPRFLDFPCKVTNATS